MLDILALLYIIIVTIDRGDNEMENKAKNQYPTERINGIRICKVCKGICHENSLRTRFGKHKIYFCCEMHARGYYADKWYIRLEKLGIPAGWNSPKFAYSLDQWNEDKEFYLEPIDVKSM